MGLPLFCPIRPRERVQIDRLYDKKEGDKVKYEQYQWIKLKDGRLCFITDVLGGGEAYAVEVGEDNEPEVDLISKDEIEGYADR